MDTPTIVSIAAAIASALVTIVVATGTISASWLIAKKYGDLAGAKAAKEYEEEKEARARVTALQALANEVLRIQVLARHNAQLAPMEQAQNAVRLPVMALETGFFSENRILSAEQDENGQLLESVRDFLTRASFVNAQIDFFLFLSAGMGHGAYTSTAMTHATGLIRDNASELEKPLVRLEEQIRRILEEARLGL